MDVVFTPHADLSGSSCAGHRPERLFPTGIPVRNEYLSSQDRADARACSICPRACPATSSWTGGEGCGDAGTLTKKLLERLKSRDARIVVLTGRNAALRESLKRALARTSACMRSPLPNASRSIWTPATCF
jgi:hypothetical protein